MVWGHLIASLNHSQRAPVQQPNSGCWCLPGAGARPGGPGSVGLLSLAGKPAGVPGQASWPLLFPWPAAPGLPAQHAEFTGCSLAVLSPRRPGGWSGTDSPRPGGPPPLHVILPHSLLPPLAAAADLSCSSSWHPLGLALSAAVFFPASPRLSSLSRVVGGG